MLPDSPDKADELARDGGTDLVLELAACHQVSKALTQPLLRRPGDLLDFGGRTLCASLQDRGLACGMTIGPGCFDEYAPDMAVAGLGDATAALALAAGVFAGHQAQIRHQLGRVGKSREIGQRVQNMPLLFAECSGIGWTTSQCSTILPS
jgi:hypothetical protein